MSVPNRPTIEKDLAEKMYHAGWVPVRAATQPVDGAPEPDMVFIKNGHIMALKVIHLKAGSSKKKVFDEATDLKKLYNRATPYGMGDEDNITVGFAIKKGIDETWYWADKDTSSILYKEEHDRVMEVLPK